MGNPTIDGKHVEFELVQDDPDGLPGLAWRYQASSEDVKIRSQDSPQPDGVIKGEDVIAVISEDQSASLSEILHLSADASKSAKREDGSPSSSAAPSDAPIQSLLLTSTASELPATFVRAHYIPQLPPHLQLAPYPPTADQLDADGPDIHVVLSIGSGTNQAQSFFHSVLQPTLSTLGLSPQQYQVRTTSSASSVTDLVTHHIRPRAFDSTPQSIILLSGDGGVSDIINALLSTADALPLPSTYTPPTIGLLALGTGNAIASSIHLLRHTRTLGLRDLLRHQPRSLPIFRALFKTPADLLNLSLSPSSPSYRRPLHPLTPIYGAAVLSYGLHASLVADSDTPVYRAHGRARFQKAAHDLLFPTDGSAPHSYRARIHATTPANRTPHLRPNEALSQSHHAYILLTPLSHLEPTFAISPASTPSDPRLRLVHIPAGLSGKEIMAIMAQAYDGGKHVENERVTYEEVERVEIEVLDAEERWRRVCVDGSIVVVGEGGRVEVELLEEEVVRIVRAGE